MVFRLYEKNLQNGKLKNLRLLSFEEVLPKFSLQFSKFPFCSVFKCFAV